MGSMAAVTSDGAGDEVGLTLIHHFVGMIVGFVDTGVAVMPSADTVSPRRSPEKEESRQEKRMTKLDITSILWLCGSLRNLVGLPRKLAMCCFMIHILHTASLGSPAGEQIEAGASPKLANLNAHLQYLRQSYWRTNGEIVLLRLFPRFYRLTQRFSGVAGDQVASRRNKMPYALAHK